MGLSLASLKEAFDCCLSNRLYFAILEKHEEKQY